MRISITELNNIWVYI